MIFPLFPSKSIFYSTFELSSDRYGFCCTPYGINFKFENDYSFNEKYHSMQAGNYVVQAETPFAESLIWQLNRDFYQDRGISAWSDNIVPHHMTSNSKVGKTYAELIFAMLKDLAEKGNTKELVYILELGAGHGRLAFHVLMHLEKLVSSVDLELPKYCYVLSDIVEENLSFFEGHLQFQEYIEKGVLDAAYFDASDSDTIALRHADTLIRSNDLNQPLIAIANYFFDSIPNELFHIQDKVISACSISIHSSEDPAGKRPESLFGSLDYAYHKSASKTPIYKEAILNEIIEEYRSSFASTYLFFPKNSLQCLSKLKSFSSKGLVLLTMDKGYHELDNLRNRKEPEIITHGSFSLWVNYHALASFCTKLGGTTFFPSFSNFHLEIGCLLFLEEGESYMQTDAAYQEYVNNFGPDDFNSIKKLAYNNVSRLNIVDLIALFRLSAYDSTFFIKLLPRLKQASKSITVKERIRLSQTLELVWEMYFNIHESLDLAYEIGGLLYDLGYYEKALLYFQYSVDVYGHKDDIYYNQVLCYYQLKQDKLFYITLNKAKLAFPDYELFGNLEKLDMS